MRPPERRASAMKVLLVVPMVPQADGLGAIPKLLHAQLTGLSERNEVTVVGTFGDLPGQAEAARELRSSGLDVHFADRRRSTSAGRRWRVRLELGASWAGRRWPWPVVSLSGGLQPILDGVTARADFDVAAIEHNSMSVLRLPAGLPTVLTEHEAARAAPRAQSGRRPVARGAAALEALDWRRWEAFQSAAWMRSDLVQVFTRGDAAAVEARAPAVASRLRVNPFGLALPAVSNPALESPRTILFAGTLTHTPNVDAARWLVREIMPAVRARVPDAHLRIVGSAPPREVLDLQGPGIEVIADAPTVEPHLAAATLVIAPVHSGGGMRFKVLEALARGKAVVTTPLGAEGFVELDPEAPLAIADGANELAAAVAALLGEEPRRRELGRRARAFAETHASPAAWAARLEAVYEEARKPDRRHDGQNRRPR
jgi:glycosyltransferase involved in cell wall biosynthesis